MRLAVGRCPARLTVRLCCGYPHARPARAARRRHGADDVSLKFAPKAACGQQQQRLRLIPVLFVDGFAGQLELQPGMAVVQAIPVVPGQAVEQCLGCREFRGGAGAECKAGLRLLQLLIAVDGGGQQTDALLTVAVGQFDVQT